VELRPVPVRLKPLIDLVLGEAFVPQGCRISCRIDEECLLHIEEDLTREAFHNVTKNAIGAMAEKGEKGGVLEITSSSDEHTVQVVFKDSGVGMTHEQVEAARRGFVKTAGGTGCGVLLAEVLVKAQGGKFEMHSTKGVGTRVSITLPREKGQL
jgi:signal transduction histidine kinase